MTNDNAMHLQATEYPTVDTGLVEMDTDKRYYQNYLKLTCNKTNQILDFM